MIAVRRCNCCERTLRRGHRRHPSALVLVAIVIVSGYVIATALSQNLASLFRSATVFVRPDNAPSAASSLMDRELAGEYSIYNLLAFRHVLCVPRDHQGSGGSALYGSAIYAAKNEREVLFSQGSGSFFFLPMAFAAGIAISESRTPTRTAWRSIRARSPIVVNEFFRADQGLMVAALLAAAMSTFDSIITRNSVLGQDIYQRYVNRGPISAPSCVRADSIPGDRVVGPLSYASGTSRDLGMADHERWRRARRSLFMRWYWWRVNGTATQRDLPYAPQSSRSWLS